MSEELRVTHERDARVAFVEICRPEAGNRFSQEMLLDFAQALSSLPPDTGCVLLAGEGGTFCLGVDGQAAVAAAKEGWSGTFVELVDATYAAVQALFRCPVPVVAAVDGQASGVGFACALLADARLATPRTSLMPSQVQFGFPLDGAVSYVLQRSLGPIVGMQLLLDPQGLSGQDMLDRGLALRPMCDPGDREAWLDVAARIASIDASVIRSSRELLGAGDFELQWQREADVLREFVESGRLLENLRRRFGVKA